MNIPIVRPADEAALERFPKTLVLVIPEVMATVTMTYRDAYLHPTEGYAMYRGEKIIDRGIWPSKLTERDLSFANFAHTTWYTDTTQESWGPDGDIVGYRWIQTAFLKAIHEAVVGPIPHN